MKAVNKRIEALETAAARQERPEPIPVMMEDETGRVSYQGQVYASAAEALAAHPAPAHVIVQVRDMRRKAE